MTAEARELQRKGVGHTGSVWRGSLLGSVLLLSVALLLSGCPKKPEVQVGGPGAVGPVAAAPEPAPPTPEEPVIAEEPIPEAPVMPEPREPMEPEAEPEPAPEMVEEPQLGDVFFDFDRAVLREDARQSLDDNIQWLRGNPAARILIEGHADERGTNEYNLALGERRARAVRDYLVAAGIGSGRVSTISYGEERPFVLGHDESAWKWNRRGHFVVVE